MLGSLQEGLKYEANVDTNQNSGSITTYTTIEVLSG